MAKLNLIAVSAATALVLASTLATPVAFAKPDGKQVFMACIGCHGENGISNNPEWPSLAGQKKEYVKNQLGAFKSGARKNAIMEPMAQTLSDEDIEAVAQYLSDMKIIVKTK